MWRKRSGGIARKGIVRFRKTSAPLEKDLCKQFYNKYKILQAYKQMRQDVFIFHIANEQNTSAAYTRSLVAMGLTAGVADYCVLVARGRVAFIEFKRDASCKQTTAQKKFEAMCNLLDIPYLLTYDVEEAFKFVEGL